jgi:hypothetical protein
MVTPRIPYGIEPMKLGNMREIGVRSLDGVVLELPASGRAQRRSLA